MATHEESVRKFCPPYNEERLGGYVDEYREARYQLIWAALRHIVSTKRQSYQDIRAYVERNIEPYELDIQLDNKELMDILSNRIGAVSSFGDYYLEGSNDE